MDKGPKFTSNLPHNGPFATHEVGNQPPELVRDLWTDDLALQEALKREGAARSSNRSRVTARWRGANCTG